jgi:hypothetical protein
MRGDCPFCGCDPYEYVDVGVGYVPVAVTCCDLGVGLFQHFDRKARQIARLLRSPTAKRHARGVRLMREYNGDNE